jgi:hypothetical protein
MDEDVAEIVRSIQIATTVNERVAQLVRPRTYENGDAMSFHLGELRQLFPEVWANLDHAREALAKRGIDVAKYDALRAASGGDGIVGVRLEPSARVSKSAALDIEGHNRATEAIYALRAAVPGMTWVDWDNLAKRQADELAAVGSLSGPPPWLANLGVAFVILFLLGLVAAVVMFVLK